MSFFRIYLTGLTALCFWTACTESGMSASGGDSTARLISEKPRDTLKRIVSPKVRSVAPMADSLETLLEELKEEEDRFVLIADTGISFKVLNEKMLALARFLNMPADTMKFFDTINGELTHAAEGEYVPRSHISGELSVEYFDVYRDSANEATLAIVGGIYSERKTADSALQVMKKKEKNAFYIRTTVPARPMH